MNICIGLFGSMVVRRGESAWAPVSGRCAGLLAYVALKRGRKVGRTELMEHVWADRGDRLNPGSFNTALWRLRRLLSSPGVVQEETLVCDGSHSLGFGAGVEVWVDVLEFERIAAPALAAPAGALPEAARAQLRAAIGLYSADLLMDHDEDWILRERERQRRTYLNVLGRLMDAAVAHGDHDEAISHAQAILDREPLRENVHRDLMRTLVANGQRALALRQFECCRTLLRKELAIQPMASTLALYREIADGAIAAVPPQRPLAPAAPTAVRAARAVEGDDARALFDSAHHHLKRADARLQRGLALLPR